MWHAFVSHRNLFAPNPLPSRSVNPAHPNMNFCILSPRPRVSRLVLLSAICAAPALQAATVLNYPDFSSVAGLQLNGAAAQVGNVLRVTPSAPNQAGSVFSTSAVTLTSQVSFSTFFSFRMSQPGGISDSDGQGADGLVFVVQTVSNTAGSAGGGIGYLGLNNSVGIEFDSWDNGGGPGGLGDPNGNHVAINTNGNLAAPLDVDVVGPNRLNDGNIWYAWVDYNGPTDLLEVRLSTTSSRPAAAHSSATVDLTGVLGSTNAFVGFTSGTGSAYNHHDVLSWEFRDDFQPITTPEGGSTLTVLGLGVLALGFASRFTRGRRN
jgi:hypothetical protein